MRIPTSKRTLPNCAMGLLPFMLAGPGPSYPAPLPAWVQSPSPQAPSPQAQPGTSQPLYQIKVVQRAARAINYRYLKGSTRLEMKGTVLLPALEGVLKIKTGDGPTRIRASLSGLPPADRFGSERLTYVLWAISPGGRAYNLGEVVPSSGGRASLESAVPLQAFGLFLTAEPHFAVSAPSEVVVGENILTKDTAGALSTIDVQPDFLRRGEYVLESPAPGTSPAQQGSGDKDAPPLLRQARLAMQIAKASGAQEYASDTYAQASRGLAEAENPKRPRRQRLLAARLTVQEAEDARMVACRRQEAARLEREQEEARKARSQREEAEASRRQAEIERMQAEALKAEAEHRSQQAESRVRQAESERQRAQALQARSKEELAQAQGETARLRGLLLKQLNAVLQTRDTVRGLIVNMPGVLFPTGKATLGVQARLKLAKVAGILLAHPGLKVEVEGHTDSTGNDAFNERLSRERAESVCAYLASQGVAHEVLSAKGLGKADPVDSNATPQGRKRNRRVELVVSGAGITTPARTEGPTP